MAKVSNCCGAENRLMADFGSDYKEAEICPRCKEHCEFVEEWERDADISLALYGKNEVTIKSETNEDLSKAAEDLFTPKSWDSAVKETLDKITQKIKK